MKVAIVFDSRTGNTRSLADAIREEVEEVVYFGEPREDIDADLYFVGSWTDKGICSEKIGEFLMGVKDKKIAYFGTAGFGVSREYFDKIYAKVMDVVDSSNTMLGSYMCQGKMPMSVRDRYEKIKAETGDTHMDMLIANFDKALEHPNEKDIEGVKTWAHEILKK